MWFVKLQRNTRWRERLGEGREGGRGGGSQGVLLQCDRVSPRRGLRVAQAFLMREKKTANKSLSDSREQCKPRIEKN